MRELDTDKGFTLIELLVALAIMATILSIAVPRYFGSLDRSKEAVLKQDLATMRNAIQQYTLDKEAGPQSIDDLVSAGYLREVPTDPITRQRDWHTNFDNVLLSTDQTAPGIDDVHSSSDAISPFENTAYSSW